MIGAGVVGLELRYPAGEALALEDLSAAALSTGDFDNAVQLARQAKQITADIPGWIERAGSIILISALTEAGDLAAAEDICAAGLAPFRDAGDLWALAALLTLMAILDLRAGRTEDAAAHLREALQINLRAGESSEIVNSLGCCGELCATTGRWANAVTIWAAFEALKRHVGFTDAAADARRHELLRKARRALGPARARAAEERGTAMNLATAAEYALMLTATGPQQPPGAPGPGKLSSRERELVILVAQGRTDAQIAAQLYISIRTVRSHLDRIRNKTGCRRRADLTRLALQAGLI